MFCTFSTRVTEQSKKETKLFTKEATKSDNWLITLPVVFISNTKLIRTLFVPKIAPIYGLWVCAFLSLEMPWGNHTSNAKSFAISPKVGEASWGGEGERSSSSSKSGLAFQVSCSFLSAFTSFAAENEQLLLCSSVSSRRWVAGGLAFARFSSRGFLITGVTWCSRKVVCENLWTGSSPRSFFMIFDKWKNSRCIFPSLLFANPLLFRWYCLHWLQFVDPGLYQGRFSAWTPHCITWSPRST